MPCLFVDRINTANGFLVYELLSGSAQVVRITHDGLPAKGSKYWFSYWGHIVGSGTFLFFYNPWDGSAAIGHITPAGSFVQATDVVSTGDALVFYIAASGKTIVGTVDRQGQFLETQSLTLTTMWTDAAATAR